MTNLDSYYELREDLAKTLADDLVGPRTVDEVLTDAPTEQYISGILFPLKSKNAQDKVGEEADFDNPVEDETEVGEPDPPVTLANVKTPSSMGLTLAVSDRYPHVRVMVRAAQYFRQDEGGEAVWKRQPIEDVEVSLDVRKVRSGPQPVGVEGLELFVRVRPPVDGAIAVTLVLVNRRVSNYDERNENAFFQPELEATGEGACFVERPSPLGGADDADLRSYALLYRHAREFAVGHGCAVDWDLSSDDPARAVRIRTTFVPSYEVLMAESNPAIESPALSLQFLTTSSKQAVCDGLEALCDGYDAWILDRDEDAAALAGDLRKTAEEHLQVCRGALGRMRGGVALLRAHAQAWEAFRFMNEAMLEQRARTVWIKGGKKTPAPAPSAGLMWRPFQLAFVLLCLRGIAQPEEYPDERDAADLLWFPTGGGKTEAYLGLIAFTVFFRRLTKKEAGGGVTAIMRYTLRLLTIQQFERAALLICACESLRRRNAALGKEEISIGMWLGKAATPNTMKAARESIDRLRRHPDVPLLKENPVQLHVCPWCGTRLDSRNYWITDDKESLVVSCRKADCDFGKRLPVVVVDEEVYRRRPTLLIATADKFATLPWRDGTGALFNLDCGNGKAQMPPELIIQDELHLISGPLGTLAGLYETAIDILATHEGIRPKVVASTATIRRAVQQSKALFNREVNQFPPAGLIAGDSYFAVEAPRTRRGTRRYVGLMAPATSPTTLMIRTYASLLQRAEAAEADDAVRDAYWTLVGYFNSLRVLGGAVLQVRDDVQDRMQLLAQRSGTVKRKVDQLLELTSRLSASEVPRYLQDIARSYPSPDSPDVVLATNMISVGVDIDRLGLMVVMGQPQSTSEYIQSTSRVGRQHPGLVVTLLNGARSRDRSHYESFKAYHSALYRQVESTSVTPFSARARDRGLHAVLVALARLLLPDFRPNAGAKTIRRDRASLERLCEMIVDRAGDVREDEREATAVDLKRILDRWEDLASNDIGYWNMDESLSLLRDASSMSPDTDNGFPTLWSLRDVDAESGLYMVRTASARRKA